MKASLCPCMYQCVCWAPIGPDSLVVEASQCWCRCWWCKCRSQGGAIGYGIEDEVLDAGAGSIGIAAEESLD